MQSATTPQSVARFHLIKNQIVFDGLETSKTYLIKIKDEEFSYSMEVYEKGYLFIINVKERQENCTGAVENKFSFLGEMTAGIIHDINNPLNSAITSFEIIKYEIGDLPLEHQPKLLDYINKTEQSLTLITEIVDGVLSFCRQGSKSLKLVNLADLAKKTTSFFKGNLDKKGIRLKIFCEFPELFNTYCYDNLMVQLLTNLLKNSMEAIENDSPLEKWIELILIREHENIIIRVKDGGTIDPKIISKVFQPMFTTKQSSQGTGLGLPFCKQIIEAHAGEIKVNPDFLNTTFEIKFPIRASI